MREGTPILRNDGKSKNKQFSELPRGKLFAVTGIRICREGEIHTVREAAGEEATIRSQASPNQKDSPATLCNLVLLFDVL